MVCDSAPIHRPQAGGHFRTRVRRNFDGLRSPYDGQIRLFSGQTQSIP
jgi:hypothetical protein